MAGSSPLIIMAVLVSVVTISYLGLSNYNLRQEAVTVTNLALTNVASLNKTESDCEAHKNNLKDMVAGLEAAVSPLKTEKDTADAALKAGDPDTQASVAKATEEITQVKADLDVAKAKVDEISKKLGDMGVSIGAGSMTGSLDSSTTSASA